MAFIKHIGKHNSKKLIVVRRSVPNEDHMALVVYTETLPTATHDALMKAVESPQGQEAVDIDEVLFRTVTDEGQNLLTILHKQGFIKKVQTSHIIMTVGPNNNIRLDELNKLLKEMGVEGKDAMEAKSKQQGLRDPEKLKGAAAYAGKEVTEKVAVTAPNDLQSLKEEVAGLTETVSKLAQVASQLEQKLNSVSNGEKKDSQA